MLRMVKGNTGVYLHHSVFLDKGRPPNIQIPRDLRLRNKGEKGGRPQEQVPCRLQDIGI